MKTKNEKISNFYLVLKQKPNVPFDPRHYTDYKTIRVPKVNSLFDLKTKQILKIFHFSFFNFINKIEKGKNFLKFIFWFEIKK